MKKLTTAVAASMLMNLVACGGGGSSSTATPIASLPTAVTTPAVTAPVVTTPAPVATTPPVDSIPSPTVVAADIQTSGKATYATGSPELAVWLALNNFRGFIGLGKLNGNPKLDKSSSNHLAYILSNTDVDFTALDASGTPLFHSEDPTRTGYTGKTLANRVSYAGYSSIYVGEEGLYGDGAGADVAIQRAIATVYHRAGLMLQAPRDVGLAVGADRAQTIVLNYGYETTPQANASDFLGSYPANTQTDVPLTMYVETPNPLPIAYADFATRTSFPISVVTEASTTLTVNTFTVTQDGTAIPLDVYSLNASTSAQDKVYLRPNVAFIVGKVPFKASTKYNVSFSGTVNGVSESRIWSFTTGK